MKSYILGILNTRIPFKHALLGQALSDLGIVVSLAYSYKLEKQLTETTKKANLDGTMYREIITFLLARTDLRTKLELNEHLEYWRVIQEMAPADAIDPE